MNVEPNSPEARRAAQKLLNGFLFLAALNVAFILYIFFVADSDDNPPEPPAASGAETEKRGE